jgi:hypothetical protein
LCILPKKEVPATTTATRLSKIGAPGPSRIYWGFFDIFKNFFQIYQILLISNVLDDVRNRGKKTRPQPAANPPQ